MQIDTAKIVAGKQKSRRQNVYDLENTLAGAEGFEPSARGFGDRCSTNWAIPLYLFNFQDKMYYIKLCVICQGIFEK